MKKFFASIILFCFTIVFSQNVPPIIPKPQEITLQKGSPFLINTQTKIISGPGLDDLKILLTSNETFNEIKKDNPPRQNSIIFKLTNLPKDTYTLAVNSNNVEISARNKSSALNGLHTLLQLIYFNRNQSGINPILISDSPRFAYRGMHLDASRHFLSTGFIKKFIDVMALYKFNQLHWHLTDGPGWRLEIKKYPLLTEKAAWRNYAHWQDWWNNGRQYVSQKHPNAYGGYYTQNEAKEIVEYAKIRGINVIPEIEMPGHSEEVLAVYPELSCTGKPYTSSEFCIGNENTLPFLKNILDEVVETFPSKYIHIGGDEAAHDHWKKCPKCQSLIKQKNLKDEFGLQSYFIKQIETYLNSKGRTTIGWDEVAERDIPSRLTVMNWHANEKAIKAAKKGHDVILTPYDYMYLNQYQTDPANEPPALGGYLPIDKVYHYEPLEHFKEQEIQKKIIGLQGCLWSEMMPNDDQVEYMAFPRALAVAENAWTNYDKKDFADFNNRLQSHYLILNQLPINYHRPSYQLSPQFSFDDTKKTIQLNLKTEQEQPEIRYTLKNSDPTAQDAIFEQGMSFQKSETIRAAIFEKDMRVGPVKEIHIDLHKAIGKKVIYEKPWEGYPGQNELTLTNGLPGGISYADGQWQAFGGNGMLVILDMQHETYKKVSINFMQQSTVGIYFPGEILISLSKDGANFQPAGNLKIDIDKKDSQQKIKRFEIDLTQTSSRFLKIEATNPMKGYIFNDEIIVE